MLGDYSDYTVDELADEVQKLDENNLEGVLGLVCELYIRLEGEEKFEELCNKIYPAFEKLEIVSDYEKEGLEFVPKYQTEHLYYLQNLVFNHAENAVEECEKTIKNTPHPLYYSLLISAYHFNEMYDKENETIAKTFDLYSDSLSARISYGFYLFHSNKFDSIEMFMSRFDPSKMTPQRKVFHINEITGIIHLACLFYAQTNRLLTATVYQQLFDTYMDIPDMVFEQKLFTFQLLCKMQMEDIIHEKLKLADTVLDV